MVWRVWRSSWRARANNPYAMNIIMVGAECAPWSKTGALVGWLWAGPALALPLPCLGARDRIGRGVLGPASAASSCHAAVTHCPAGGLGDVMQALPKALAARGHRVAVVAPRYRQYEDAWETGVRLRLRVFDSDQEVGGVNEYGWVVEVPSSSCSLLLLHAIPTLRHPPSSQAHMP